MRAAVLEAIRQPLLCREIASPDCPADGVVLRVLASGVCRSDWHVWTGADPVPLPFVPGHEFCGEIVETGRDVAGWAAGDRVVAPFILACGACPDCAAGHQTVCARQVLPGFTAPGSFAEYLAVPHAAANLARLPEGLDPAMAAVLGCRATTAWAALTGPGRVQGGEWLAVFGGGGVGTAALILGRALGARVVVVDVVPEKLAQARDLGAEAVVNAGDCDAAEAVRGATDGGAHVALEALGRPETVETSLRSLRHRGRMVQVGMPAGEAARMALPWDVLYARQLSVHGTRGMAAHRYPSLLGLIAAGRVDLSPMIGRRIALSAVSGELAAMDGPTPPGVAVVTDFAA